jgi:hypothetical protein
MVRLQLAHDDTAQRPSAISHLDMGCASLAVAEIGWPSLPLILEVIAMTINVKVNEENFELKDGATVCDAIRASNIKNKKWGHCGMLKDNKCLVPCDNIEGECHLCCKDCPPEHSKDCDVNCLNSPLEGGDNGRLGI